MQKAKTCNKSRNERPLKSRFIAAIVGLQEIHLCAARSSAPFRVQSKELLGQLHLQVAVHRAVVVARAAGLQNPTKGGRQEVKKGGKVEARATKDETSDDKEFIEQLRAPSKRPPPVFSHSASAWVNNGNKQW